MQSSDGRLSSHEKLVEISLKYIAVHSIKVRMLHLVLGLFATDSILRSRMAQI